MEDVSGEKDDSSISLKGRTGWRLLDDYTTLRDLFGGRFLLMIVSVQWLLKGFSQYFTQSANPYLLRAIGPITASDMQVQLAFISLPWALKPLMGITSDFLPILGYHKVSYMTIFTLLGIVSSVYLVVSWPLSTETMVWCAMGVSFNVALCDLLMEARYSAKIKQNPEQGPIMISFIQWGQAALGLIASLSSGVIIQYLGPQWNYVVPLTVGGICLWGLLFNYPQDTRVEQESCVASAKVKFEAESKMVLMAIVVGVTTLIFPILGTATPTGKLVFALVASVIVEVALYKLVGGRIFKVVTSSFVFSVVSPSTGSAAYFFATDTAEQYPNGPHFTPVFYVTALGVVQAVCTIVSIAIYNRYMTDWSYRTLYYIGFIAYIFLSIPLIIFYLRYNLVIGLPDKLFMVGENVVASIIYTWFNIPAFLLLSQLVKKGSEASLFSITAGMINMGNIVSSYTGAWLLSVMNVEPTGEPNEGAQFQNLWLASLIPFLLSLVMFPVIPWAIPDVSQKVNLDLD